MALIGKSQEKTSPITTDYRSEIQGEGRSYSIVQTGIGVVRPGITNQHGLPGGHPNPTSAVTTEGIGNSLNRPYDRVVQNMHVSGTNLPPESADSSRPRWRHRSVSEGEHKTSLRDISECFWKCQINVIQGRIYLANEFMKIRITPFINLDRSEPCRFSNTQSG